MSGEDGSGVQPFPVQLDVIVFVGLMASGLALLVGSLVMKHIGAAFATGGVGFWMLVGAIRYGAMAMQIHHDEAEAS